MLFTFLLIKNPLDGGTRGCSQNGDKTSPEKVI
jgi:hypothetical protein